MILATLAEFSYTATPRNNTSHLIHRFLFLPVTLLALTAGLTFYIAIVENQPGGGRSLALILGIARFHLYRRGPTV